jgi:NADH-quinone oxidoreductase subunit F
MKMNDGEIIEELLEANLLGRGGAAYPAGRKWQQLHKH